MEARHASGSVRARGVDRGDAGANPEPVVQVRPKRERSAAGRSAEAGTGVVASGAARLLAQRIVRAKPVVEAVIPDDASERFLAELERELGAERFDRYARGRVLGSFTPSQLKVTASSRALGDLFQRRFMTELHRAAERTLGRGIAIQVEALDPPVAPGFASIESGQGPGLGSLTALSGGQRSAGTGGAGSGWGAGRTGETMRADTLTRPPRAASLTRYRLEDFVVGESNRLAYNAGIQLAEAHGSAQAAVSNGGGSGAAGGLVNGGMPGYAAGVNGSGPVPYSLLFLHGPCGVGKTHLVGGAALRFRERHPGAVVRVTSGEAFMSEFVTAIRDGGNGPASGIERFRKNYRRLDLLCIDDVQSLANKQATQSELLHTFEEIARSGARIVLASDQHPRSLERFSPALISRFLAGMVAGMSPPDEELTRRLVRTLAMRRGLVLDESAAAALAAKARLMPGAASGLSVREIEGLLTRIEAVHKLLPDSSGASGSGAINLLTIERALGGSAEARGNRWSGAGSRPVRIESIIAQTCRFLSVDPADLSGRTRHKRVVLARAVITHLARQFTTMSYPEIARALGRPNHSTVITAYQRLASQIAAGVTLGRDHVPEPMSVQALVDRLGQAVGSAQG